MRLGRTSRRLTQGRPWARLLMAALVCAAPAITAAAPPATGSNPAAVSQAAASQATQDSSLARSGGNGTSAQSGDSLAAAPNPKSDSVIVVKHSFDHREQIITGSVVMTCLMLMMVTMNNYNPR